MCSCMCAECKCVVSKDVKSERVQTEVFSQKRREQATWITLDDRTPTRTDIGTPGQQHHYIPPSPPLRSTEDLRGKTRLAPSNSSTERWAHQPSSAAEQSVPLEQSSLTTIVEEALKIIHEANKSQAVRQMGISENPRESWLWDFDFMKLNQWSQDTSDVEVWIDVDYLPRFWGGVMAKKQRLRRNAFSARQALHVEGLMGVQRHNHHLQEWDPWKVSLGEWVMINHEHSLAAIWRTTSRRA